MNDGEQVLASTTDLDRLRAMHVPLTSSALDLTGAEARSATRLGMLCQASGT